MSSKAIGATDLLKCNPYNIVAIELAARYEDAATEEDYARCARLLSDFQRDGVLVRDDAAFYVYEQEFAVPGAGEVKKRRGVLGALRLEPFGPGVQPHEHTLSGPKQDRLNLLRAVRTNTSPIFGLYSDGEGWMGRLIEDVCFSKPLLQATDEDGIHHRVWRVLDDEMQNGMVAALADESVLIADGHHRYETALNFQAECKAQAEAQGKTWTGDEDENFVLMMLVSMDDEGLIVLPTHRVVKNVTSDDVVRLQDDLAPLFDIELVATESDAKEQARALLEKLNGGDSQPRIGMHIAGKATFCRSNPAASIVCISNRSAAQAYNALDVTILHRLILEKELGITLKFWLAGRR
jgi:uncharacterized protein (DUF1015 family)